MTPTRELIDATGGAAAALARRGFDVMHRVARGGGDLGERLFAQLQGHARMRHMEVNRPAGATCDARAVVLGELGSGAARAALPLGRRHGCDGTSLLRGLVHVSRGYPGENAAARKAFL